MHKLTFNTQRLNILTKAILALALFATMAAVQAKTAVAVDLDGSRPFGTEPWGIATGNGTRPELQGKAKDRCIARGGRLNHIVVVFGTTKVLSGYAALAIGQNSRGAKFFYVHSGRTPKEASDKAIAEVRRMGAVKWYVAKGFVAKP